MRYILEVMEPQHFLVGLPLLPLSHYLYEVSATIANVIYWNVNIAMFYV